MKFSVTVRNKNRRSNLHREEIAAGKEKPKILTLPMFLDRCHGKIHLHPPVAFVNWGAFWPRQRKTKEGTVITAYRRIVRLGVLALILPLVGCQNFWVSDVGSYNPFGRKKVEYVGKETDKKVSLIETARPEEILQANGSLPAADSRDAASGSSPDYLTASKSSAGNLK